MTTQAGQAEALMVAHAKPSVDRGDRGWQSFVAGIGPAIISSPVCDGNGWTVKVQKRGQEAKTYGAPTMRELIALVGADWGVK